MDWKETADKEEIFSKVLRAGRRTYFFDVRATKAGDYYLTITESKKHDDGNGHTFYKKHKIYLYKEDFENFSEMLEETTNYIIENKGKEVISEIHNPNFKKTPEEENATAVAENTPPAEETKKDFTNVEFDDI